MHVSINKMDKIFSVFFFTVFLLDEKVDTFMDLMTFQEICIEEGFIFK